jgi:hypothetical protein
MTRESSQWMAGLAQSATVRSTGFLHSLSRPHYAEE